MGPRKRAKPNPKPAPKHPADNDATNDIPASTSKSNQSEVEENQSHHATSLNAGQAQEAPPTNHTRSWYSGTWSHGNKSTPVTQVAKESITAAVSATSDAVTSARTHTPPLVASTLRKSLSRTATETPNRLHPPSVHASDPSSSVNKSEASLSLLSLDPDNRNVREKALVTSAQNEPNPPSDRQGTPALRATNASATPASHAIENGDLDADYPKQESSNWLSWFSKSDGNKAPKPRPLDEQNSLAEAKEGKAGNTEPYALSIDETKNKADPAPPTVDGGSSTPLHSAQQKRQSWLNIWSRPVPPEDAPSAAPMTVPAASNPTTLPPLSTASEPADSGKESQRRSSGWAFWSHDVKDQSARNHSIERGELAVAGSPSQTKPEKDTVDNLSGVPAKVEAQQASTTPDKRGDAVAPALDASNKSVKLAKSKADTKPLPSGTQAPKNLLLPDFGNTFDAIGKPGFMQQLARWFPFTSSLSHTNHLDKLSRPPQIRNALVIGVHGYFPTPLVRSLLGQPTGTSIRFANSAASAIQKWTEAHGYTCEIEKVALEGEGKIAERVDLLWRLLLNWIDKIRKADFVFVACHSQGCPVALELVAKLISFGCVSSARLGVCAMAGVNHGPFSDYRTRWIGSTALELFDFGRHDSAVSRQYHAALETALKFGVKILYVGSIDDQLVSMESSTFSAMNHPNIYRAVFVDGRVHAPDFLTHLVGFALKLRNLGVSDHGLIRELSGPLAGSLYSGEGHSRIYDDEAVYYLAIQHALETTSSDGAPLRVQTDGASASQNPYILPFAMRGLLEEQFVKTELQSEIMELIRQFDEWKPSSKVLKDVKFRLEGVRSRL